MFRTERPRDETMSRFNKKFFFRKLGKLGHSETQILNVVILTTRCRHQIVAHIEVVLNIFLKNIIYLTAKREIETIAQFQFNLKKKLKQITSNPLPKP